MAAIALADTANLVVQLRLDDKFSGPLGKAGASLGRFQAGVNQVGKGVGQVGAGLARVGTIAATGFAVGIGAAVKVAGDFEAQLNTINTIAKLNDTSLTTLGQGIRDTFKETGAPLEELTAAYYDLLSAGVKVGDAQGVLNTAVKLGIGGLATTKESVDLLTTAINAYGLNASQAGQASDIFAAAVRDGKVVISELNASFADVAPLAAQVGIKLEEIGAAYATLTARGVPATEVGTQFNRAIIELLKPGPELVQILKGLGESSFDASLKQKGLVATLEDVRKEAERQGIPFQDLFGRLEAYKFALATTGPNQAQFTKELTAMGHAAGETQAQFEERQKGLNFQLARLKALAQDAGITIGNALIPKLVPLIERLNTFIQDNQGQIATFGQKLADGFSAFADKLGTIDFEPLIDGLKIASGIAKSAFDIFTSLPPALQGAIITGFAVNKLSGGLLAKGVGNIAGGIIQLTLARGSSPANPLWVASVGGVGGGPGGAAAGGSLLGGIAKFVLGPAAAVIIGSEIAAVLNEPTIAPTRDFEKAQFKAVVDSKDLSRIVDGLHAIETQQNTSDVGAQVALIASNIPFIGDALGHVGTVLDDQKQALLDQLQEMGLTRAEAEKIVAAQEKLITESGANAVKLAAKIEGLHLPLGLGNVIAQQILNKGAAQVEAQNRVQAGLDRWGGKLDGIAASGQATASGLDRWGGKLDIIAAKETNLSVTIPITNNVTASLSVSQALTQITSFQSIRYDGKLVPI